MINCNNVVFSSVSLRRNIKDMLFVNRLSDFEQAVSVSRALSEIFGERLEFKSLKNLPLDKCYKLLEKGEITKELIENKDISAYGISADCKVRVFANEEDHIRIETRACGKNLEWCYSETAKLDDILLDKLEVAFDNNLGYLTANPNKIGTGLEVCFGLFLPSLITSGKFKKIYKTIITNDFEVISITGEKWDEKTPFVCIKNKYTFGQKENEFAENLTRICEKLLELEQSEENNIFNTSASTMVDDIFRAYGILNNAYRINLKDAEIYLGYVLWGLNLNLFEQKKFDLINLLYKIKENHLQQGSIKEQEKERARLLNKEIGKLLRKGDIDV